jgi:hypothetical protein
MKKVLIFLIFILLLLSCGKTASKNNLKPINIQKDGKETYFFKVSGLQDSIVSDSIWKMIFQQQGIDKLVLSKTDSSAVFTIDPKLITGKVIVQEIEKRGGKVLN